VVAKEAMAASAAFRSMFATDAFVKIPWTNELPLLIRSGRKVAALTIPCEVGSGKELFAGNDVEIGVPNVVVLEMDVSDSDARVDALGKVGRLRVGSRPNGSSGLKNFAAFVCDTAANLCFRSLDCTEADDVALN
jgi:hypothetical protein